jgi:ATP-dependent DNA helicase PIF1
VSHTDSNTSELSAEQKLALPVLQSADNVFVTGGAGCGKSFLINHCRSFLDSEEFPILASTGAAAVLIGGRTFHSFFGLGIMEGGPAKTFDRAIRNGKLKKRLNSIKGIILDEISMISGEAFTVAETIAKELRKSTMPWGGLRIIAVGDFAQLPPISRLPFKDWCFKTETWSQSQFKNVVLKQNQRVGDYQFLKILNSIRIGNLDDQVKDFLQSKTCQYDEEETKLCLFSLRQKVDDKNTKELSRISEETVSIPSIYLGEQQHYEAMMKASPVPSELKLKVGCKVLFVKNDPGYRWINGTRGTIKNISEDKITVKKDFGREVTVEKSQFSLQDADGNTIASIINFPLILAYAITIHRSQGATLDQAWVDLSNLWEPGHAYVGLSRFRTEQDLSILGWQPKSFRTDSLVTQFYRDIQAID